MHMGVLPKKTTKKDWKTISKEKLRFDADQSPPTKSSFDAHGPPNHIIQKIKQQQIAKTTT